MMKKKVLYLHGFASAGSSGTAVQMRSHLYPMGASVLSPDIPVSPLEAMDMLRKMVEEERPDLIVATSMGALYAEQLYGTPRLLVKRADGARDFKVDRPLIAEFQQVEKQSFSHIDAAEKGRVYGLFGLQDKKVNCQPDFKKHYGKDNLILFQGEHYLNGQVLGTVVMPLVEKLLFGE